VFCVLFFPCSVLKVLVTGQTSALIRCLTFDASRVMSHSPLPNSFLFSSG